MKRAFPARTAIAALAILFFTTTTALAAGPERWLHVRVDNHEKGEMVRVNVPLSLAEKVLPTIHEHDLNNGKISIGEARINDVDLKALLDAIRTAPDNEFVSVQNAHEDVRVAKAGGNLVVHVRDDRKDGQKVEITVPMTVVDALLSTGTKELDLVAAIHALGVAGDTTLVTVEDATEKVRIWIDSKNASE